jgi:integrase
MSDARPELAVTVPADPDDAPSPTSPAGSAPSVQSAILHGEILPSPDQAIQSVEDQRIAAEELMVAFVASQHPDSTKRAYQADWRDFAGWATDHGYAPLPAEPVAVGAYLASLAATKSRSTIQRRLSAIAYFHHKFGAPWHAGHPLVRATLRGINRSQTGANRKVQAAALTSTDIRKMIAAFKPRAGGDAADDRGRLAARLCDARDRAMLLIGFAGAFRRSELTAIASDHVSFEHAGVRIFLPASKTDHQSAGQEVFIPRGRRPESCPVRAIEAWMAISCPDRTICQPVFRKINRWAGIERTALSPGAMRDILRRRAEAAGVRVPAYERLSPHGLRAGFITEAYHAGARDEQIMSHTRHRSLASMRSYVRRAKIVTESPGRLIDL